MNSVALRKTLACVLAVATIGTSSVLPIAPSIFNTGIVASAASNTVKYKYKTVSGGVMFLGYADTTYDKDDNEQLHYPSGTTMDIPASILYEASQIFNVDTSLLHAPQNAEAFFIKSLSEMLTHLQ